MSISTTTIVVLVANGLMAVVTAALLMLVLWQAPRQRANQLFALVMLTMGLYGGINAFSRFVGNLGVDPRPVFYLATTFYGAFVVAIFFFASEFAQSRTRSGRAMRIVGLGLLVFQSAALWTGQLTTHIRPLDALDGGYRWDWTPLGLLASAILIAYLIATGLVLFRLPDERGRALWPAPLLVVCAALSATLIWPVVHIPFNALFLAAAAVALGLPVLRYELFNPLADLNQQLAAKNIELLEANRMKSQFLANMSHELRTPLNSIIGYTELVLNGTYGALNDTQRDRLEKVVRNGHHLLGLINDVLDLNRIEAGRITLERHSIPTAALIDTVLTTVEPLANRKGLSITRDYAGAPPIYGDEMRLRQIVTNILANAVKFTEQGGIIVRASRENDMVRLEFHDTGIGISPDQVDVVFAEFRQVDSSATRRHQGTGLGMTITKRLIELHGGEIWLESAPGQGTTFFVRLPVAQTVIPAPNQSASAVARPVGTVLVIDDLPEALEMLSDTLSRAGYRVVIAQSGSEGLMRARQLQPDLILLDVMMPGLDGWQVLRALKDEPSTRQIPVVIVSIIDNRPLAIGLGADESLTKPLDRRTLLTALDSVLARTRDSAPILVVDDRSDDRELILSVLEQKGYPVAVAAGGQEAIDWLAEHIPSLIVLDLMMPEVSGFDVLAFVRHEERLTHVPVIVVTAKTLTSEEHEYLRQRCVDLVQKGFAGPDLLLQAVHKALVSHPVASVPLDSSTQ